MCGVEEEGREAAGDKKLECGHLCGLGVVWLGEMVGREKKNFLTYAVTKRGGIGGSSGEGSVSTLLPHMLQRRLRPHHPVSPPQIQ